MQLRAPTVWVWGHVFRRCSRVSVALHAYAIATQATSLFLWQDFHLQDTEQLSNHSEGDGFLA